VIEDWKRAVHNGVRTVSTCVHCTSVLYPQTTRNGVDGRQTQFASRTDIGSEAVKKVIVTTYACHLADVTFQVNTPDQVTVVVTANNPA
jgi:hypothetical protein